MSDIQTLMRSANPVPDASQEFTEGDLKALLTLTLTRSGDMDVKEIMTPVEPDGPKRSGWLVAAASFAVVVLVAGVAMLLTRTATEELVPPATDATPTTQASPDTTLAASGTTVAPESSTPPVPSELMNAVLAYESAFNDWDEEAFRAVFAPGAVRVPSDVSVYQLNADVDGLVGEMLYYRARGSSLVVENCSTVGEDISCMFVHSGPFETAAHQTNERSRMRLVVDDGQILSITAQCGICSMDTTVLGDILEWAGTIDQADSAIMGAASPFYARTAEAGRLWLTYATMWRASDGSSELAASLKLLNEYETAFNDGDAERLAGLLSPEFQQTLVGDGNIAQDGDAFSTLERRRFVQDTRLTISDCIQRPSGVRCNFAYDGPVERALFNAPATWIIDVETVDNSILLFHGNCSTCGPAFDNPNDKVIAWVKGFAPEDAALMGLLITNYLPNDDAPLLWLKYAVMWDEAGRP